MNAEARRLIAALQLAPLPGEGGFFRQTWRSDSGSAILYLMTPEHFSAVHRIAQDEVWHFYAGDPVEHSRFDESAGKVTVTRLGPQVLLGEQPQLVVPRGVWQAARLSTDRHAASAAGFALLGCTVTPPWDERGFELGERTKLTALFPAEGSRIAALTR